MHSDVLTGNIRQCSLIPKRFRVQDSARLSSNPVLAKCRRTQKQAKLERHVEPGNIAIQFHERNVVDAQMTGSDQILDLVQANLTGIVEFSRTMRGEAGGLNGEHHRVEQNRPIRRERRVDENRFVVAVGGASHALFGRRARFDRSLELHVRNPSRLGELDDAMAFRRRGLAHGAVETACHGVSLHPTGKVAGSLGHEGNIAFVFANGNAVSFPAVRGRSGTA